VGASPRRHARGRPGRLARRVRGRLLSHHEIVLVRHGETAWSKSGQHTGVTDLPLTHTGRKQAEGAGRLLAGRRFALVLVSPLSRARDTAELAGYGDQAEVDPDLLEWNYGDMEGRTIGEIRETYPGWTVWKGPMPGGETIEQVAARTERVIARALAVDGDVALFGHGHCLRVLTARWCELDPREGKRFPLLTATLCELGWEHEDRAVNLWNDRA
jgi:probable phosphoglycerate mutase